jgi:transcriptional regulator with XRE-family HTH domain
MFCPTCGNKTGKTTGMYHYHESGLDYVWLKDWPMYSCVKCKLELPLLPSAAVLDKLIAWAIISFAVTLDGDAISFLRKAMGLKAVALAEILGVTRVEVSRWENGHASINRQNEFMLRMEATRRILPRHLQSTAKQKISEVFMRPLCQESAEGPALPVWVLPEMEKELLTDNIK